MKLAEKLKIRREMVEKEEAVEAPSHETIIVETEDEFLDAIGNPEGPVTVVQKQTIEAKRENSIHALFDAKPPERIKEEAEMLPLEAWSKVVARLDNRQQLKVDHSITAMALIGMFPVAVER